MNVYKCIIEIVCGWLAAHWTIYKNSWNNPDTECTDKHYAYVRLRIVVNFVKLYWVRPYSRKRLCGSTYMRCCVVSPIGPLHMKNLPTFVLFVYFISFIIYTSKCIKSLRRLYRLAGSLYTLSAPLQII